MLLNLCLRQSLDRRRRRRRHPRLLLPRVRYSCCLPRHRLLLLILLPMLLPHPHAMLIVNVSGWRKRLMARSMLCAALAASLLYLYQYK